MMPKTQIFGWVLAFMVVVAGIYGVVYYMGVHQDTDMYEWNTPAVTNEQELMSVSASLDAIDVNQIDGGLDENKKDVEAF